MTRDSRGDVLEGLEGMTPGPWKESRWKSGPPVIGIHRAIGAGSYTLAVLIDPPGNGREANDAIATAISRLPDLIAEVKALRGALREIADMELHQHEAMNGGYTCPGCIQASATARSLLPTPSGEGE